LDDIAANYLRALQETIRADRSAFGLYDSACAAGERLAGALPALAEEGAESEHVLIAPLVSEVGGDGGTLADATVRRGLATAVRDVRDRHPELDDVMRAGAAGGGLAWDILCDLYKVFFADIVGEFLRSVVAEHVKLAVPVLAVADPEGRIADWVAEKLVDLVPNPCEESTEAQELAEAVIAQHEHEGQRSRTVRQLLGGFVQLLPPPRTLTFETVPHGSGGVLRNRQVAQERPGDEDREDGDPEPLTCLMASLNPPITGFEARHDGQARHGRREDGGDDGDEEGAEPVGHERQCGRLRRAARSVS
jgi:hypothetical protein